MGLSIARVIQDLGISDKGVTGFYITKAIMLSPPDPRALVDKLRIGILAFVRYVASQEFASRDARIIGDDLVGLYDEEITAAAVSQTTLDHRRNSCVAIVNLARELAKEDGHEVGPIGLRRPIYDARSAITHSTLNRLSEREEFGHYLTRALETRGSDGIYRFSLLDIPIIRIFVKYIDEVDPRKNLKRTDQLGSLIVEEFKGMIERLDRQAQYRRKCVRLADRLMLDAMQLATWDGKTVGARFAIPFSDDKPKAEPQAARNDRRIEKIARLGPLQAQLAEGLRFEATRLVPGSIHAQISNIQPLLRYLEANPSIASLSDLRV